MQTAIIPLSVNLDKVLEKLNGTGKDRKIRRKDMENIFDDIVKGEAGKTITRLWHILRLNYYSIDSVRLLLMFFLIFFHANNRLDGKIKQFGEVD